MRLFQIATLLCFVSATHGSSCGEAAIPFSFEALENGQPVLGCARPTCFGWTADARPVSTKSQFYRINGVPDGFLRKSTELPQKLYGDDRLNFREQTAYCESTFDRRSCASDNEWVGGIGPVFNASTKHLSLQCCTYDGLRQSTDRGVAVVKPGQIVIGGEVTKKGRQYAFDYISDIVIRHGSDKSISYDVSVRRFPCVPVPNERSSGAESEVHMDMLKKFNRAPSDHMAFQAPIHQISDGGLQQIGVQETIERVVETPVRQQVQEPLQIVEEVQQPVQVQQQVPQYVYQVAQPQPQPQYYYQYQQPVQYYQPSVPAAVGTAGGYWCFSADTLVHTSKGKDVRMDELTLNDWVLARQANKLTYLPVKSWLHRLPKQKAQFQQISLEDGTSLKLTNLHYIYKTNCQHPGQHAEIFNYSEEAVQAGEIKAGDCVLRVKGEQGKEYFEETVVIKNIVVNDTGIFAPLTASGDIVANGVHTSCFAVLHSNAMQSVFFDFMDRIRNLGKWLFAFETDAFVKDIPYGTELFVNMIDLVLPKNLHTF